MVIPRRLLKGVALLPLILTVAMVAHSPTEAASFTDVKSAAGLSADLAAVRDYLDAARAPWS